jgi:chemotaxis protein methyltransferase CheR
LHQDIRSAQPDGPFDLVLCGNLVFTYFETGLQRRALVDIAARMRPGAALVIGKGETLPDAAALEASPAGFGVYWKGAAPSPVGA